MAKLSELKKVELLENAVLAGDIEQVKSLFAEHGSFEFTARALGIACRFIGAEMEKLLLAERGLISLHESKFRKETAGWSDSSLRRILKNDFFPIAFDEEEQALIQTVTLENKGIKDSKIPDDKATKDKVFLLSADEVRKYFLEMNSCRTMKRTEYAEAQYTHQQKRGTRVFWLLRTRGDMNQVGMDISWGELCLFYQYTHTATLRPAIWVK